ncbi:RND family efflux transporter MFP subunit [Isoalcanivorax pacificus W11-5]|uniref:RND family efflux transporter MFP subunit n=1 Tax=Isoalcanivorax pacificus W11-5 TaxID=391936 RepID=A0A0B4XQ21_9GAMM|nr:efflux RND transporter periplasmic adaptor subunit [Isoalcanivorax pacificus]AJD49321.1 RND family efflux transporter MFP subunit [Isoalcanivorax pacificus W11-5]
MRRIQARHWGWLVPVAAVVAIMVACSGREAQVEVRPVTVRTAPVLAGEDLAPLRFAGVVRARQRAELTFQVSGTLHERPAEIGQPVVAGDLMARLRNPQLIPARDSARARIRETDAQLRQAEQEYQRAVTLRERGVLSEQDLEQLLARRDALEAGRATAQAALAEADQLLRESELRAPFAGTVEAVLAEPGEFVAAGQPVLRLSSALGLEVEVRIPEILRTSLKPGDRLTVWRVMERGSEPLTGVVTEIGRGSRRGELYPLVVSLDDPSLAPGVSVEVGVPRGRREALALPVLAVFRSSEGPAVFRVRDNIAERVPVTVLQLAGEQVLVSGEALSADDQVVYAGLTRLVSGDRVTVIGQVAASDQVGTMDQLESSQ